MITGVSIKEFGEYHQAAWHIERGYQFAFRRHLNEGWLMAVMSDEIAAQIMRKIEMALDSGELDGFTLFFHAGKGWQMSTQRRGERGWSIEQGLTDEQVRPIFDLLEPQLNNPESPLRIKGSSRGEGGLFGGLTAAILARIAE